MFAKLHFLKPKSLLRKKKNKNTRLTGGVTSQQLNKHKSPPAAEGFHHVQLPARLPRNVLPGTAAWLDVSVLNRKWVGVT